jgi:AcrR family transcriptional regulator
MTASIAPIAPAAGASPDTAKKTRRLDRRVVRTREALIEAGYALFAEKGLHEVSIDEIIEKASVSKQTFYNHFNEKRALALAIYSDIREEFESGVQQINADVQDPAVRIARGICLYVRKALDDPDHVRFVARMLIQDNDTEDPANRGLIRDLETGLAAGRLMVRSPETGAAFVLGASEPLLAAVLADRTAQSAISLAQDFITLILRGLAVDPIEAELIASQSTNQLIRPGQISGKAAR